MCSYYYCVCAPIANFGPIAREDDFLASVQRKTITKTPDGVNK